MYTYIRVRLTCTLYILWHELFYFSVSLHALYTNQPEHVYVCIYRAYNTINKMLHTYIHTKLLLFQRTTQLIHSCALPSFPPLLELSCAKRSVGVGKQDKTYVMGGGDCA